MDRLQYNQTDRHLALLHAILRLTEIVFKLSQLQGAHLVKEESALVKGLQDHVSSLEKDLK